MKRSIRATPASPARQPLSTTVAAARIVHPFPTLLNVAATAGLAFVAADGAPETSTLARMMAAMFCAQSAIGVTNDLFDRELDVAAKPWKPVASGIVRPGAAVALAATFVAAALALALTLGAPSAALMALGIACGLAYDARLKRSRWSALPFMVAIPTLPLWVWVTLDAWEASLWTIVPLGALIGLSLHLANTLPDIESDAEHGVRGLAHRLGTRRSALVARAAFASALALTAPLAPLLVMDLALYTAAVTFAAGCLAVSVMVPFLRRDAEALRLGFGVLGVGAAVAAVGWLAAVT